MSDVDTILDRALRLAEEQDYGGMVQVLETGVEEHPDDAVMLCWLAFARREGGDESGAYELFRAVLALEPDDPWALAMAGAAVARYDDPDAEGALRSAALMAPGHPFPRLMYGAYLIREGLVQDGIRELQAAAALDDEDPQIAFELGVGYALARSWDKARLALARGLELDPGDGWARVILGLVEVEDDDLEEGMSDLVTGAEARPGDFEAQLLAALSLAASGWEDRAYEMLERARHGDGDVDETAVAQVGDRIDEGADACREALSQSLGPSALRERLMVRP